MATLLDTAINAARVAGEIILAGWGQTHRVELKGVINPVTEIDRAAEEAIVKILRAALPDCEIFAEESSSGLAALPTRTDAMRWVVDPLDGTVNYTHHFPYFGVSIALEQEGRAKLGVIYDPMLDQLFSAERGRGAFLNGNAIQVSAVKNLAQSIIATGFPYDVWETGRNTAELAAIARRAQSVRVNGAAVLDLAYVACGRLDAYFDSGVYAWDMAAGELLIEEAGGVVSYYGGDPNIIESRLMIASNPHIHSEIARVVLEPPSIQRTQAEEIQKH